MDSDDDHDFIPNSFAKKPVKIPSKRRKRPPNKKAPKSKITRQQSEQLDICIDSKPSIMPISGDEVEISSTSVKKAASSNEAKGVDENMHPNTVSETNVEPRSTSKPISSVVKPRFSSKPASSVCRRSSRKSRKCAACNGVKTTIWRKNSKDEDVCDTCFSFETNKSRAITSTKESNSSSSRRTIVRSKKGAAASTTRTSSSSCELKSSFLNGTEPTFICTTSTNQVQQKHIKKGKKSSPVKLVNTSLARKVPVKRKTRSKRSVTAALDTRSSNLSQGSTTIGSSVSPRILPEKRRKKNRTSSVAALVVAKLVGVEFADAKVEDVSVVAPVSKTDPIDSAIAWLADTQSPDNSSELHLKGKKELGDAENSDVNNKFVDDTLTDDEGTEALVKQMLLETKAAENVAVETSNSINASATHATANISSNNDTPKRSSSRSKRSSSSVPATSNCEIKPSESQKPNRRELKLPVGKGDGSTVLNKKSSSNNSMDVIEIFDFDSDDSDADFKSPRPLMKRSIQNKRSAATTTSKSSNDGKNMVDVDCQNEMVSMQISPVNTSNPFNVFKYIDLHSHPSSVGENKGEIAKNSYKPVSTISNAVSSVSSMNATKSTKCITTTTSATATDGSVAVDATTSISSVYCNMDGNVVGNKFISPLLVCPSCKVDIGSLTLEQRTLHVNKCFDAPPNDALLVQALSEKNEENSAINNLSGTATFASSQCFVCNKDLGVYTIEQKEQHINRCLDSGEGITAAPTAKAISVRAAIVDAEAIVVSMLGTTMPLPQRKQRGLDKSIAHGSKAVVTRTGTAGKTMGVVAPSVTKATDPTKRKTKVRKAKPPPKTSCFMCGKSFDRIKKKSQQSHKRSCAKKNGISTKNLIALERQHSIEANASTSASSINSASVKLKLNNEFGAVGSTACRSSNNNSSSSNTNIAQTSSFDFWKNNLASLDTALKNLLSLANSSKTSAGYVHRMVNQSSAELAKLMNKVESIKQCSSQLSKATKRALADVKELENQQRIARLEACDPMEVDPKEALNTMFGSITPVKSQSATNNERDLTSSIPPMNPVENMVAPDMTEREDVCEHVIVTEIETIPATPLFAACGLLDDDIAVTTDTTKSVDISKSISIIKPTKGMELNKVETLAKPELLVIGSKTQAKREESASINPPTNITAAATSSTTTISTGSISIKRRGSSLLSRNANKRKKTSMWQKTTGLCSEGLILTQSNFKTDVLTVGNPLTAQSTTTISTTTTPAETNSPATGTTTIVVANDNMGYPIASSSGTITVPENIKNLKTPAAQLVVNAANNEATVEITNAVDTSKLALPVGDVPHIAQKVDDPTACRAVKSPSKYGNETVKAPVPGIMLEDTSSDAAVEATCDDEENGVATSDSSNSAKKDEKNDVYTNNFEFSVDFKSASFPLSPVEPTLSYDAKHFHVSGFVEPSNMFTPDDKMRSRSSSISSSTSVGRVMKPLSIGSAADAAGQKKYSPIDLITPVSCRSIAMNHIPGSDASPTIMMPGIDAMIMTNDANDKVTSVDSPAARDQTCDLSATIANVDIDATVEEDKNNDNNTDSCSDDVSLMDISLSPPPPCSDSSFSSDGNDIRFSAANRDVHATAAAAISSKSDTNNVVEIPSLEPAMTSSLSPLPLRQRLMHQAGKQPEKVNADIEDSSKKASGANNISLNNISCGLDMKSVVGSVSFGEKGAVIGDVIGTIGVDNLDIGLPPLAPPLNIGNIEDSSSRLSSFVPRPIIRGENNFVPAPGCPDYTSMSLVVLKGEMKKNGMSGSSKNQMVKKLTKIYNFTYNGNKAVVKVGNNRVVGSKVSKDGYNAINTSKKSALTSTSGYNSSDSSGSRGRRSGNKIRELTPAIEQRISEAVRGNEALHADILEFRSIKFDEVTTFLFDNGIDVHWTVLRGYFEKYGITYQK